jgi:hypothetical protein
MWYKISLLFPFIQDPDYEDFVLLCLFKYTNLIDISLKDYHELSVDVSQDTIEAISKLSFVKSVRSDVDRAMLTSRVLIDRDGWYFVQKNKDQ